MSLFAAVLHIRISRKNANVAKIALYEKNSDIGFPLEKQLFSNVAKMEFFCRNSDIFQLITQYEGEKTEATGLTA